MPKITQRIPAACAVALAAAFGLGVTGVAAQEEQPPLGEEQEEEITCQATIAPASLLSEEQPAILQVTFSEEIGTTTEVRPQEGSGIEVVRVEKPEEIEKVAEAEEEQEFEAAVDVPAYDVQLHLNTANAAGGQWALEFEGTMGKCLGTVDVAESVEPTEEEFGEPPLR